MRSAPWCWKSGAQARQFDLVASRKLTLAAQASGVTGLLLRVAAEPLPSTAETTMDRARGAFAAGLVLERVGRAGVRRAACPQPSWPCWAVDHGMEM